MVTAKPASRPPPFRPASLSSESAEEEVRQRDVKGEAEILLYATGALCTEVVRRSGQPPDGAALSHRDRKTRWHAFGGFTAVSSDTAMVVRASRRQRSYAMTSVHASAVQRTTPFSGVVPRRFGKRALITANRSVSRKTKPLHCLRQPHVGEQDERQKRKVKRWQRLQLEVVRQGPHRQEDTDRHDDAGHHKPSRQRSRRNRAGRPQRPLLRHFRLQLSALPWWHLPCCHCPIARSRCIPSTEPRHSQRRNYVDCSLKPTRQPQNIARRSGIPSA